MRVALGAVAAAFVAALAYLLAWPVDVAPEAWTPTPAVDRAGVWAVNDALAGVTLWPTPGFAGPEDVAVAPDGSVVTGVSSGELLRFGADGSGPVVFARTGGRPLGLDWLSDGRLVVADGERGLLTVTMDGVVAPLCAVLDGEPVNVADDVEVGPDGTVWFTDATTRFAFHDWKLDVVENGDSGRLLSCDPATGRARVRLTGLHFANGVAVAADGSFVLVAETPRYQVRRLWLTGDKAGTDDVFVDGIPGFVDGISRGEDGMFWLAVPSPRNAVLDLGASRPWLRRLIARLPKAVQPAPERHPMVVGLDSSGRVVHVLEDPRGGSFAVNTSVQQVGDVLWLGSLGEPALARIAVP